MICSVLTLVSISCRNVRRPHVGPKHQEAEFHRQDELRVLENIIIKMKNPYLGKRHNEENVKVDQALEAPH